MSIYSRVCAAVRRFGGALGRSVTKPRRERAATRRRVGDDRERLAAAFDAMEKRLRRRERELEARRAQLEDVLRALPEGVCVLWGPDGPSLTMNRAAEELLDFSVAAEGGTLQVPNAECGMRNDERSSAGHSASRPPHSALEAIRNPQWRGLALVQSLLAAGQPRQVEVTIPRRDGREVTVQVSVTPTRDRDGEITGSVAVLRDISEVKEREARLRTAWQEERSVAEALQQSFVPRAMPELPEFDFGHAYRPARRQERVGGDFYDVVALDADRLAFAIGDVSGKGVDAALYTAMAKNMWRAYLAEDARPGPLLERLNDALARYMEPEYFVTMACGVIDRRTGALEYGVAGHPAPLLRRAGGACEELPGGGMVLGAMPGLRYETGEARMGVGDLLLLYTDGMTELRRDGAMLEVEGLRAWLEECPCAEPAGVVAWFYERAREWSGDRLHDDVALLALRSRLLATAASHPALPQAGGNRAAA